MLRLVAAALAVTAAGPGAAPPGGFTFTDPAITESSGLVVDDATGEALFVTTNDSGDTGRVFTVDPTTGDTVGVTTWSQDPVDVEALAPAGPGEVWVADIGDNVAQRSSVSLALVPVGRGDTTVEPRAEVELRYPGGATDAETLLVDPDGRMLVVTKSLFGGEFLRTEEPVDPAGGSRSARLVSVAAALPIATDGAFFPDGRHLVLRSYGAAVVYAYPSLEAVGRLALPAQEQGEGIAVDDSGAVYLSSEGERSDVLRVRLPDDVRRAMAPADPGPSAGSSTVPSTVPPDAPAPDPATSATEGREAAWSWAWVVGGAGGLAALLLALVLAGSRRPRG